MPTLRDRYAMIYEKNNYLGVLFFDPSMGLWVENIAVFRKERTKQVILANNVFDAPVRVTEVIWDSELDANK